MWATQVIGHVLALGRSAVLPLIDASGAFDSLSHRYIDDMMKRQKVDDKGRSIWPLKGEGFFVKRIVDSAGGPANRSYEVDWSRRLRRLTNLARMMMRLRH